MPKETVDKLVDIVNRLTIQLESERTRNEGLEKYNADLIGQAKAQYGSVFQENKKLRDENAEYAQALEQRDEEISQLYAEIAILKGGRNNE